MVHLPRKLAFWGKSESSLVRWVLHTGIRRDPAGVDLSAADDAIMHTSGSVLRRGVAGIWVERDVTKPPELDL